MRSATDEIDEPPEPGHVRMLSIVTALVIGSLWVAPLFSSLWVDELGTWWVVKDGVGATVDRAFTYQGQSPLYYLIVWAIRSVLGNSEVVLRLPSLLAGAASAILLYRIARRLISREAARLTVVVFAAGPLVAFESSEARPYAIATLALIASTYALIRWLDEGRRWSRLIVYAALAVLLLWLHYIFVVALVPHAVYAFARVRRRETEVSWGRLAAAAALVICGVVPLAVQIASLWDRRASLSVPDTASVQGFILAAFPPVLVGSLILGALFARAQGRVQIEPVPAQSSTFVLLASWLLVPIAILFLVTEFTPLTFTWPRYLASSSPAAALLGGWVIASLHPASVRRLVAVILAILTVLAYGGRLGTQKNGQDWRGAAALERRLADPNTIVLLHPAVVESGQLSWFTDPEKVSYLLSVTSYYPMDGRIVPMPYVLDAPSSRYLEGLLAGQLSGVDRFFLITGLPGVPFRAWFEGRLALDGYRSEMLGDFGDVQVIEFSRTP